MNNLALYVISVLIWGSTWFAIEFQLGIVEPEVSIVYRYVGASLLLFGWSFYRRLNLSFGLREHGWFLLGQLTGSFQDELTVIHSRVLISSFSLEVISTHSFSILSEPEGSKITWPRSWDS